MRRVGVMGRCLQQPDGLGIFANELLRRMFELDAGSRYVLLVEDPRAAERFRGYAHVEVHVLPGRNRLWWDQVQVARAARRLGLDVLFNPKFSLPLFSRVPGVFILHSCDWYVNPGNYPWWDNVYIRMLLPWFCRRAAGLLAISHSTLAELARHLPLQAPQAIGITHASIATNFSEHTDPREIRALQQDYGLPPRYILSLARVWHTGHRRPAEYPGANCERLLRAYARYRAAVSDPLPLVLLGRDVDRYLEHRGMRGAQLEGVCLPGHIPNERLHAAYHGATCFVLCTLCESFGLPILEALRCGCPAIVPATGAGPEVSGGAARLIDPLSEADIAAALIEVSGSGTRRERMRRAGIERARAFSWEHSAGEVLKVLDVIRPRVPAASPRVLHAGDATGRKGGTSGRIPHLPDRTSAIVNPVRDGLE